MFVFVVIFVFVFVVMFEKGLFKKSKGSFQKPVEECMDSVFLFVRRIGKARHRKTEALQSKWLAWAKAPPLMS